MCYVFDVYVDLISLGCNVIDSCVVWDLVVKYLIDDK